MYSNWLLRSWSSEGSFKQQYTFYRLNVNFEASELLMSLALLLVYIMSLVPSRHNNLTTSVQSCVLHQHALTESLGSFDLMMFSLTNQTANRYQLNGNSHLHSIDLATLETPHLFTKSLGGLALAQGVS
jgi:hypothetical protein